MIQINTQKEAVAAIFTAFDRGSIELAEEIVALWGAKAQPSKEEQARLNNALQVEVNKESLHAENICKLLVAGASIKAILNPELQKKLDEQLLSVAAKRIDVGVNVLLLLGADANVSDKENGYTPLHHMSCSRWRGSWACLQNLVSKGAELDATYGSGVTPWMCFCANCKKSSLSSEEKNMACVLLYHGANPDLECGDARKGLDFIKHDTVRKELCRMIRDSRGAREQRATVVKKGKKARMPVGYFSYQNQ